MRASGILFYPTFFWSYMLPLQAGEGLAILVNALSADRKYCYLSEKEYLIGSGNTSSYENLGKTDCAMSISKNYLPPK